MTVQLAEKYLRELCAKYKRINVTPKFIQALECILKAGVYCIEDEVGFKSFSRLWIAQILHYNTVPWDNLVQKELARSIMAPTHRVMYGISETLGDLGVDRYFEKKTIITLDDLKRMDDIRGIYNPKELERKLRPMYAQLKLENNDI